MNLGTTIPAFGTDERLAPAATVREWARGADDAGFERLWSIDHLLEPPTYRSNTLDPIVTFGHAAAVTDDIAFGTSVLLLPLRRTVNVARRTQTLRHLSGRDVTLGLGAGYAEKMFEATGVPRTERGPRLSEGIDVLQRLFDGETSYDGRFHSFEDVRIDPVVEPPPRLLAGGDSNVDEGSERWMPEPMLRRIRRTGGWIAPPSPPGKLERELEIVASHVRAAGTDPDSLDRVLLQYVHLVDDSRPDAVEREQRRAFEGLYSPDRGFEHARENCLTGTTDEVVATVAAYRDLGFDEVVLGPITPDPTELDEQLRLLERDVLPEFA